MEAETKWVKTRMGGLLEMKRYITPSMAAKGYIPNNATSYVVRVKNHWQRVYRDPEAYMEYYVKNRGERVYLGVTRFTWPK